MTTTEADAVSDDIRRAAAKLRLANQLQRDARYLNNERRKIIRKMRVLEMIKNERRDLEAKLALCDGLIRELEAGKTEMQKALKESGNLVEKNKLLLDKAMSLKSEVESLEKTNNELKAKLQDMVKAQIEKEGTGEKY